MVVHSMARVEVDDFETWLSVHRTNAQNRRKFGIVDGPIYRDIDKPNAILVHTWTEDPSGAAQWFQTEAFKEASIASGARRRIFYTATEQ